MPRSTVTDCLEHSRNGRFSLPKSVMFAGSLHIAVCGTKAEARETPHPWPVRSAERRPGGSLLPLAFAGRQQQDAVQWWRATVRRKGGRGGVDNADSALSVDQAESVLGFDQQTVSRWAKKLADRASACLLRGNRAQLLGCRSRR